MYLSKGIYIYTLEGRIKDCTVTSSGSSQAFGAVANGKIDITDIHITALGTAADTELNSVYSLQDNSLVSRDEDSVLITPYLSVICTKENQIFLAGWDAFWYNNSETRLHLLMPFPYGAGRVFLQYSTDGENFSA